MTKVIEFPAPRPQTPTPPRRRVLLCGVIPAKSRTPRPIRPDHATAPEAA